MSECNDILVSERDPNDPKTLVIRRGKRRRKSLVMWSGGLDSTWSLLKLLRDTDEDIYVHHVHKRSRTDDGREISKLFEAESQAIKAMRVWLKEHERPFVYSESAVDLTAFSTFARDVSTCYFFASQAAMTWGFQSTDRIVTGANSDDDALGDADASAVWRTRFRVLTNRHLIESVMQTSDVPDNGFLKPVPSRREQAAYLPKDLLALVVCCRSPVEVFDGGHTPCGTCQTCHAVAGHVPGYGNARQESDIVARAEVTT